MTEVSSATMTYASVVSRESVRIALTLAALNDLEVKTADIENAYLTAPIGEKIWCTLDPEFGEDAGLRAIIVRALYGLKSAGAFFRNLLADCMRHLGWEIGDPEFYLGAKLRPTILPNGVITWGMSTSKYVQAAVAIVKSYHSKEYLKRKWRKSTSGPFPSDYAPEHDTTNLLDHEKSTF